MKEPTYDIRELAAKWMDGTITSEEKAWFEAWYNRFDFSELELPDHWATQPEEIEAHILQKLQTSLWEIKEEPVRSLPFVHEIKRGRWWIAAASVSLLISAGSYFFYLRHKDAPVTEKPVAQMLTGDVAPGRSGAVLTLSNGSRVDLDSTGSGHIATQGNSQVDMQNGAVVYEKAAAEGSVVYNTMTTPRGRQFQLVLPDGSRVWLNAASSLHYPTSFTKGQRTVELTGEAYFEIAKDERKPFVVSVRNISVQVLGTAFDVMAYPDEMTVNTTLVSGAVRVVADKSSQVLEPDEQASLADNSSRFTVSKPSLKEVLAWKEGRFRFDGAKIATIMRQISRWYDVDIEYKGDVPLNEFNGSISRAEYVQKILHALERTGNVHFSLEGRKIVVMAGPR